MSVLHVVPLRAVLAADAAICALMGVGLSLVSGPLGEALRIPSGLLLGAGIALLPIAAFIALVATRTTPAPLAVWAIVAGNAGWVAASLLLPLGGWIAPNALGMTFLIAQALAVVVFAAVEAAGVRSRAEAVFAN